MGMTSQPPKWWNNIPAHPDRFEWNQDNTEKLFDIHFDGKPASIHLKTAFEDLLDDAERIMANCASGRKRRALALMKKITKTLSMMTKVTQWISPLVAISHHVRS